MAETDSPEDKPATADLTEPPSIEIARGAVDAAMEDLFRAIKTLERSARWNGFVDGWKSGREGLIEEFQKAIADRPKRDTPMPLPMAFSASTRPYPPTLLTDDLPPNAPAKDRVLQLIRLQPGLRGTELASTLERSFSIKERTVRTSLHRLRGKKIRNVDGRWYLIEDAPADPQLELKE